MCTFAWLYAVMVVYVCDCAFVCCMLVCFGGCMSVCLFVCLYVRLFVNVYACKVYVRMIAV